MSSQPNLPPPPAKKKFSKTAFYKGIRADYPTAFAALIGWIEETYDSGVNDQVWMTEELHELAHATGIDFRDLYDFFDHLNLLVSVYNVGSLFHVTLYMGLDVLYLNSAICADRSDAEAAAFAKAFEQLEQQIHRLAKVATLTEG